MKRDVSKADWTRPVPDEASVVELAAEFARSIKTLVVIYLEGELGAGKTTFARAFIQALGFKGYVKSPSYGLLESYEQPPMDPGIAEELEAYVRRRKEEVAGQAA